MVVPIGIVLLNRRGGRQFMKIRNLDLTHNPINEEHQQLGLPPVEEPVSHPGPHPLLHGAMWFIVLVLIALVLFLTGRFFVSNNWLGGWQIISETLSGSPFWSAVMVGFFAQVVDGALGMAYGVTATTFLLATGPLRHCECERPYRRDFHYRSLGYFAR